ncbi:unnamed protein product [Lampetra planeri]
MQPNTPVRSHQILGLAASTAARSSPLESSTSAGGDPQVAIRLLLLQQLPWLLLLQRVWGQRASPSESITLHLK